MVDQENLTRDKRQAVALLVIAEVFAMSLWFVSSAVIGDVRSEFAISNIRAALLASSVPAGFVIGALTLSITGIADRFDPRRIFALAAVIAGFANLALVFLIPGSLLSIVARCLTGLCLAGVYPVGMKIIVGWGTKDRGWLVGLLVGGLTFGTAAPHMLSFLGGADWRLTTALATASCWIAALLILFTQLGPHHQRAPKLDARAITHAWHNKHVRMAYFGYLGHMWELYAMWSWLGVALLASFSLQVDDDQASQLAKLTSFTAIAVGGLMCPLAGHYADRIGKAELTILAMFVSGSSAVLMALVFGGPVWLVILVAVLWGASVIPDSAQFSALVADHSPPDKAGSLMSLQTALGFLLTIFTVQVTPWLAAKTSWPALFVILSLGPLFGIVAMMQLRKLN